MDLEAKFLAAVEAGGDDPEPQRARDETDDYDREEDEKTDEEGHSADDNCGHPHHGGGVPRGPQTGVKGVLNEKRQFDRAERERQEQEVKELMERIRNTAITLRLKPEDEDLDELDVKKKKLHLLCVEKRNVLTASVLV